MLRKVLKADKNSLTIRLPDDLVGKRIEIIVFSIDNTKSPTNNVISKEDNVTILKGKLKKFTFNSGGYKFDRDDANHYK
jgi:hypothetical protein